MKKVIDIEKAKKNKDIKNMLTPDITEQVKENHERLDKLILEQQELLKELDKRGYEGETKPKYLLAFTNSYIRSEDEDCTIMLYGDGNFVINMIIHAMKDCEISPMHLLYRLAE